MDDMRAHGWEMRFPLAVWAAILLHLIWGATLIATPTPLDLGPIRAMQHLTMDGRWGTALALIGASAMSGSGMWLAPRRYSVVWYLPQQGLLISTAYGAVLSMGAQTIGGMHHPFGTVFAANIPYLILPLMFTVAIFDAHGGRWLWARLPFPTSH